MARTSSLAWVLLGLCLSRPALADKPTTVPRATTPQVHQVVDRATITAHVWDNNHDPFANVLEVLVRRLRSKIDDGHDPKLITTIRGAGYRIGPAK